MKAVSRFVVVLLLAACDGNGDGSNGKKDTDLRILAAGAEMSGNIAGVDRYAFADGAKLEFVVNGQMVVTMPEGVVLDTEFPADVTFAVRSTAGDKITGRAEFASIAIDGQARFRGETAVKGGTAIISGAFVSVTDATFLDVQGFSYPQPVSAGVQSHELVLQGSRLAETRLTPSP